MTRRDFGLLGATAPLAIQQETSKPRKGRVKQGVTRGVFGKGMSLEEMARHAARLGAVSFDLLRPDDWPLVRKYGLVPSMVPGAGSIVEGCNKKENHPLLEKQFLENIPRAAAAGCPNVITMAGSRRGMPDEQAWENCSTILKKVTALAEDKGVTICMELLNSKVDHPDYHCDHTKWGVELCKRVNSPRFKLLYDIYHMQIMEGDIIRTIRENIAYIAHFHTAGNPGRHEPDESQEILYRPIAEAIVALGYTGYFVHEYSPTRDPLASLDSTLSLCDV